MVLAIDADALAVFNRSINDDVERVNDGVVNTGFAIRCSFSIYIGGRFVRNNWRAQDILEDCWQAGE